MNFIIMFILKLVIIQNNERLNKVQNTFKIITHEGYQIFTNFFLFGFVYLNMHLTLSIKAQDNVGIETNTPNANSILKLFSTNKEKRTRTLSSTIIIFADRILNFLQRIFRLFCFQNFMSRLMCVMTVTYLDCDVLIIFLQDRCALRPQRVW